MKAQMIGSLTISIFSLIFDVLRDGVLLFEGDYSFVFRVES